MRLNSTMTLLAIIGLAYSTAEAQNCEPDQVQKWQVGFTGGSQGILAGRDWKGLEHFMAGDGEVGTRYFGDHYENWYDHAETDRPAWQGEIDRDLIWFLSMRCVGYVSDDTSTPDTVDEVVTGIQSVYSGIWTPPTPEWGEYTSGGEKMCKPVENLTVAEHWIATTLTLDADIANPNARPGVLKHGGWNICPFNAYDVEHSYDNLICNDESEYWWLRPSMVGQTKAEITMTDSYDPLRYLQFPDGTGTNEVCVTWTSDVAPSTGWEIRMVRGIEVQ